MAQNNEKIIADILGNGFYSYKYGGMLPNIKENSNNFFANTKSYSNATSLNNFYIIPQKFYPLLPQSNYNYNRNSYNYYIDQMNNIIMSESQIIEMIYEYAKNYQLYKITEDNVVVIDSDLNIINAFDLDSKDSIIKVTEVIPLLRMTINKHFLITTFNN